MGVENNRHRRADIPADPEGLADRADRRFMLLARNPGIEFTLLDLFPVHRGHALVIPRHHCERVEDLSEQDHDHLFRLGRRTILALQRAGLAGDAQNLLINNGPAANQHVPHVHLHVLPRQVGDSPATMWSWTTRMLKRWSMNEKRRQLDELAARIGEHFSDLNGQ